jgi:hypothetical protein
MTVFAEALSAASSKVGARGEAKAHVERAAKAQRDALASLVAAFIDGRIDRETFEGEMAEEKRALRGELAAVHGISTQQAQRASSAFFDVIEGALASGIRKL